MSPPCEPPFDAVAQPRLLVGIDEAADVGRLVAELGLEDVELSPWRLSGRVAEAACVHRLALRAGALPGVTHAEPDWLVSGERPASVLPAMAAHRPPGRRDVLVAIIDDGIAGSDPGLTRRIADHYDAMTGLGHQAPAPWERHGTAAALAVAARCNSDLLAVKVLAAAEADAPAQASAATIADGIDWAWQRGAAVILAGPAALPSSREIAAAITRARSRGRGGRGTPVVSDAATAARCARLLSAAAGLGEAQLRQALASAVRQQHHPIGGVRCAAIG